MINPKFLPTVMIVLSVLSAASYAYVDLSDWRKIGYWISGAVLTYCVTY